MVWTGSIYFRDASQYRLSFLALDGHHRWHALTTSLHTCPSSSRSYVAFSSRVHLKLHEILDFKVFLKPAATRAWVIGARHARNHPQPNSMVLKAVHTQAFPPSNYFRIPTMAQQNSPQQAQSSRWLVVSILSLLYMKISTLHGRDLQFDGYRLAL